MSLCSAFTPDIRLQKWKDILDIGATAEEAKFENVERVETLKYSKTRVINQDVLRTRADETFFKSPFVKSVLKQSLIRFCSYHRIEYMQGLNEILAPMLTLDLELVRLIEDGGMHLSSNSVDSTDSNDSTDVKHPFTTNLLIFERVMNKLSPTTFSTRGVDAIQVQLTTFHLLLMYHEPVLATILRKEGMTPDIYAMSWLITLFARRQPVERALHVWDLLLQMDAPHLCVYLSVALIRSRKDQILSKCADALPATLVSLKFESDEEIDLVFADAVQLMQLTPMNVTSELKELGFNNKIEERTREKGLKDLWHRPCVISNASEIARHLAQQLDPLSASSFARTPRYLVLDCRFTVEKQLLDAHYIEGSVGVPQVVQEEICALARHKSALLEHGEMEMELSDLADPADIERSFAGAVAQLSMRTAAVLALLWAAFVNDTTEEVHFAIADDSAGPYECPSEQNRSPLNTSYALPYQTASGASDGIPLRQRAFSDATENLPQYLTHSTATLSNVSAINFASALIILGFPRVSIVQGEVIFKESRSNENLMFSCTENNSFSSLPVMKTEQRSSGFTCLVHHLGACGVNTSTINARYSYIQVPVDHFKEYQVTAFAHQLRTSVMSPDHIDLDFYSCTAADNELLKGATPGRTTSSSSKSGGKDSTGGKSAPSSAQKAPPVSLVAGVISATSTVRSSSSFSASSSNSINNNNNKNMSKTTLSSSISSALSAFTPGVSPRSTTQHQTPTTTRDNNRNRGSSLDAPLSASLLTTAGLLSALGGFDGSPTSSTMMQAKLSCNLDNLFQLLLIMSAQKKRHIIRLVIGSNFHSTVPLARVYSHSPLSEEEFGYARLLGPKPEGGDHLCDSKFSPTSRVHNAHNLLYYEKLERLLTLRDTLQELVNTQRLNDVLDKTSNRMITKMRLLRSAIEQTNKHTRRSVAGLQRKTILRSTQQRLQAQAEAHASSAITTIKKTNGAEIGVGGGHEEGATAAVSAVEWHVSQDLSAFFRAESGSQPPSEQGGSRSSSVLRDSISVDGGGDRGSRLMSDDSIDIQTNISKSLSDLL